MSERIARNGKCTQDLSKVEEVSTSSEWRQSSIEQT